MPSVHQTWSSWGEQLQFLSPSECVCVSHIHLKKFVLIYVLIHNYAISWSQQNCQTPVPREQDLGSVPAILSWWTLDNSYKIPSLCLYLKNEKQLLKNSTLSLAEKRQVFDLLPSCFGESSLLRAKVLEKRSKEQL